MLQRYKIIFKQQKIQKNNYILPILSPSYKSHNRPCGSHPIAPIIARAFTIPPRWRKLAARTQSALPFGKLLKFAKVFLPLNSKFTIHNSLYIPHTALLALLSPPFWGGGTGVRTSPTGASLLLVPEFKIQNSKFIICQFPSHYLERIIGFKNAYLYGV